MRELIVPRGSDFLPPPGLMRAPSNVMARILAADTPESFSVPTGAEYVMLTCTSLTYVQFLTGAEDNDLVSNGDFALDSGWTKGTGWTTTGGTASCDDSQVADSDLTQTPATALIEGQAYQTIMTTSGRGTGNVTVVLGDTEGSDRAGNTTYTETIIAGSGADIDLRADATFDGNVDDFSVTPVAIVPAADRTEGYASLPITPEHPRLFQIGSMATISICASGTPTVSAEFWAK